MITLQERFSACIVINNNLIPNTWNLEIKLIANNNTQRNYNLALDRIQFYIDEILNNSILLSPDDVQKFTHLSGIKGTIHPLPGDPYDHLISVALYTKFNSILEKVFLVDSIGVSSFQGDGITHTYDCEFGDMETLMSYVDNENYKDYAKYWYDSKISFFDITEEGLKLINKNWQDLDLEFEINDGRVVKLSNFRPTIVSKTDREDDDPKDAS